MGLLEKWRDKKGRQCLSQQYSTSWLSRGSRAGKKSACLNSAPTQHDPSSSLRLIDRWLHEDLAEFHVGTVGMGVSLMKHFLTAHRVGSNRVACGSLIMNRKKKKDFFTCQRISVLICDGVLREKNSVDLFFYCFIYSLLGIYHSNTGTTLLHYPMCLLE